MKIRLTGVYPPKELDFDNVKSFSIIIIRRRSQIMDIGVEVEGSRYYGLEKVRIEEEKCKDEEAC